MKQLTYSLAFVILAASSLSAQDNRLQFGIKGGVPLYPVTSDHGGINDESRRFAIGPLVEFRASEHFAVEFSPLYRRLGSSYTLNFAANPSTIWAAGQRFRGDAWEFPVTGKYYLRNRDAKTSPFLLTGYSLRRISGDIEATYNPDGTVLAGRYSATSTNVGAHVGAGIDWKASRFHLAPEVRYTRWGGDNKFPGLRQNQLDFLLGVRF